MGSRELYDQRNNLIHITNLDIMEIDIHRSLTSLDCIVLCVYISAYRKVNLI